MRYIPVADVEKGMELGQNIYDGAGTVLWEKGFFLTDEAVWKLQNLGISGIYVEDEFSWDLEVPRFIEPELKREALRLVHDLFQEEHFRDVEQDDIQQAAGKITRQVLAGRGRMYNLIDTRISDDYTFFHSINVAVLAVMLGAATGNLGLEELNELAAAALLHDVGKRYVEQDVLNARRGLTEEERLLVVQHPKLSYDFLREHYDFSPEICTGVLEHHEWYLSLIHI